MKIKCLQEVLEQGLSIVGRNISTDSPVMEAMDVLIREDDGQVRLSGVDLDTGISTNLWIGANIEGSAAVSVPARTINDLIRSLNKGELELELTNDPPGIKISSPNVNAHILGHAGDKFPPIETVSEGQALQIPADELAKALKRVLPATSTEGTRPVLTGVKMDLADNTFTLAAADGYRLAIDKGSLVESISEPLGIVVPRKALLELRQLIENSRSNVQIRITPDLKKILFKVENVELVSQIMEGSFPDYLKLVPSNSKSRIVTSLAELRRSVKSATALVRDAGGVVRFMASNDDAKGGTLTVVAQAEEIGDYEAKLPAKIEGDEVKVAFACRFLDDMVDSFEGEELVLETSSHSSPALYTAAALPEYRHVIMPVFVQW